MLQSRTNELTSLAESYFDTALSHVDQNAELNNTLKLRKAIVALTKLTEDAELPGYENRTMKFGKFENREFVVMMTDIRKSTEIINGQNGLVNMFLIFYVYAGIVAKIVDSYNGTSTEFLGDGVLNLFDTKELGTDGALKASMEASWDIMDAKDLILNPLFTKNGLPQINLGIGIDHGLTIVTKFGYRNDTDLKAFGRCAYNASKLCKGFNEILVSDESQNVWPSGPDGTLQFQNPRLVDGKIAHSTSRLVLA